MTYTKVAKVELYTWIARAPYNGAYSETVRMSAAQVDDRFRREHPLRFPDCAIGPDNHYPHREYFTDASAAELEAAGFVFSASSGPHGGWIRAGSDACCDETTTFRGGWHVIQRRPEAAP